VEQEKRNLKNARQKQEFTLRKEAKLRGKAKAKASSCRKN
jgi:hypothetical protein